MKLRSGVLVLLLISFLPAAVEADDEQVFVYTHRAPSPAVASIDPGDSVRFVSRDSGRISVVDVLGEDTCSNLGFNESCSKTYGRAGTFPYSVTPGSEAGSVVVSGQRDTGLSVASPATNAAIVGIVEVSGTASDVEGVARVEYKLADTGWIGAQGTETWSFSFDSYPYARGPLDIEVRVLTTDGAATMLVHTLVVDNSIYNDIQVIRTYVSDYGNVVQWALKNQGNEPVTVTFTVDGRSQSAGWLTTQTQTLDLPAFGTISYRTDFVYRDVRSARVAILDVVGGGTDAFPDNDVGTWPATHQGAAAMVRIVYPHEAQPQSVQIPLGQQVGWQFRDNQHADSGATIYRGLRGDDGEWCPVTRTPGVLCYRTFNTPGIYDYEDKPFVFNGHYMGQVHVLGPVPTIAIATPDAGAVVSGTVTVSGTVAAYHAMDRVEVKVGYGDWMLADGTDAWSLSFPVDEHSGGWQTLQVRGIDEYGQEGLAEMDINLDSPVWPDFTVVSVQEAPPLGPQILGSAIRSPAQEIRAEIDLVGGPETADVLFEYEWDGQWYPIGRATVAVPGDGRATASVQWVDPTPYGAFQVRATVDPDEVIPENRDDNNDLQRLIRHGVWHRNELGHSALLYMGPDDYTGRLPYYIG